MHQLFLLKVLKPLCIISIYFRRIFFSPLFVSPNLRSIDPAGSSHVDLGSFAFHRSSPSPLSTPSAPTFGPMLVPGVSPPSASQPSLHEKSLFFGVKQEFAVQVPSALEGISVEVSIKENVQEFCRRIIQKYIPESIKKDGKKAFSDVKGGLKIPQKMFLITELALGPSDEEENISKMILEIDVNICDKVNIIPTVSPSDGTTQDAISEYFKKKKLLLDRPLRGLWTLNSLLTDSNTSFANGTGAGAVGGGISKLKISRNHSVNFVDIFHGEYHSRNLETVGYGIATKKDDAEKVDFRDKTKNWEATFVRDESVRYSKTQGNIMKSAKKYPGVKSYEKEFRFDSRIEKKVEKNQRNLILNSGKSVDDGLDQSPVVHSEGDTDKEELFLTLLIDVKLFSCPEGVSTSGVGIGIEIGGEMGSLGSVERVRNSLEAADATDADEKSKSICDVSLTDFSLFRSNNDPSGFIKMRSDVLALKNPTVVPKPKSLPPTDSDKTVNDGKTSRVLKTLPIGEYPSVLLSSEIPSSQFSVLGGGIEFKLTVRPERNSDPQIPLGSAGSGSNLKRRRHALNKNTRSVKSEDYEVQEQHEGMKWVRGMMLNSFTLSMRSGGLPGPVEVT
jgi:hypothetical protein